MKTQRVTTDDGVELEVAVTAGPGRAGEPAAPLVMVHGFGGAKEDFADHVEALAGRGPVVTFDHRGHGESSAPPSAAAYSLDRLASDVLAVAEAAGLGRFRLLGHSMGGMVARRVARARPDVVEALVLMDTSPGPVPGVDREIVELGALVALSDGMPALKELMDATPSPLDTPAYVRLLEERPGYREFCDRKFDALSAVMWATMARAICDQPDETELLAGLACPTLVVVGALDAPFVEPSRRMAATIPGAHLEVIADAGHSPQFETPAAWFAVVDRFIASLAPIEIADRPV